MAKLEKSTVTEFVEVDEGSFAVLKFGIEASEFDSLVTYFAAEEVRQYPADSQGLTPTEQSRAHCFRILEDEYNRCVDYSLGLTALVALGAEKDKAKKVKIK